MFMRAFSVAFYASLSLQYIKKPYQECNERIATIELAIMASWYLYIMVFFIFCFLMYELKLWVFVYLN